MELAHVWLLQEVSASWKKAWCVHRCLDQIREPLLLRPERGYQDQSGVVGPQKFVEDPPDQCYRREGIEILIVPVVQEGIRSYGLRVWKRRHKVGDPVIRPRGEEIHRRVTPKTPEKETDVLMESPLGGKNLIFPAESVGQNVAAATDKLREDSDRVFLRPAQGSLSFVVEEGRVCATPLVQISKGRGVVREHSNSTGPYNLHKREQAQTDGPEL